ncbi:bifunctional 5,10-methylene-tetrahydrofolate dehydrogenase/5,10-methylene-tetrahydrofolate cyclohydrolase [bacterium]|nr:bifunctional 5,10-methylene-tetrahydrofolate dehydrogenase/5,10-methylene-tetrahydrofolate cyclohydrolase [bacterium]
MTIILDGKQTAEKITENIKKEVTELKAQPTLAVVLVGSDKASQLYVRNKHKKAEEVGFKSIVINLPEEITENNLLEQILLLNDDVNINAILIQLPLPEHINKERILDAIHPLKDVDGFTSYNFGRLALGYTPFAIPCTPKGIIRLLDEYKINIEGKNAIVIGRSNIVGKPTSILMQKRNATVTVAHSKTKDLKEITKTKDIIISAIGKPKLITADYVKDDAIVIDVGINRTDEGLCGDVDYKGVFDKVSYITPVPGGIGPMTIAMLLENTLELYKLQKKFMG